MHWRPRDAYPEVLGVRSFRTDYIFLTWFFGGFWWFLLVFVVFLVFFDVFWWFLRKKDLIRSVF